MAKLRIRGDTSGYVDIAAPDVAGAATVNLDKIPQTDQVANFTSNVNVTGQVNATISSSENPAGYFRNTSGSGNSPALVARGGANNTTAPTFEVQDYNGNVDFKVDGNGHVTMPFQPAFMAIGASTTVPTSTDTQLQFNTTTFNTGGHYNTSTYRFTAPVTGVYYFHCQVRLGGVSGNGRYDMVFRKNGTGAMGGGQNQQGSNDAGFNVSAFLSLAANDYVDVVVNQNNGSSLTTNTSLNTSQGGTSAATHFFGYLVK